MIPEKHRDEIYHWLETPVEFREDRVHLRKRLHYSPERFREAVMECQATQKALIPKKKRGRPAGQPTEDKQAKKVLDALFNLAVEGRSAFAAKTYLQATGRFVEKQEIKHGLSADEIARRNLEAERQLREGGYRVEEVQEKRPVLPEDLRED